MQEGHWCTRRRARLTAAILVTASAALTSCGRGNGPRVSEPAALLRVGVAQVSQNPTQGLRQLSNLLAVEGLARPGEDGRMQPWLAESWTTVEGGRVLRVKLRPHVKFHDGSAVDAKTLVEALPDALRRLMTPRSRYGFVSHRHSERRRSKR
jgi:peptide/nickel transport system substrate-binding protein